MFHCLSKLSLIVSFLSLKIVSCEACHHPRRQALKTAANRPLRGWTFIGCRNSSDASAANWTWRSSRGTKRTRSDAAQRAGPHKYHFRGCRTSHQGCNGCAPSQRPQYSNADTISCSRSSCTKVLSYTPGTIDQAPLTAVIGAYNQPSQPFYGIAVNFGSRER